MEESYWEQMKSGVADMVNTGGRQGGSITAALFLKQVSYSCHPAKKLMKPTLSIRGVHGRLTGNRLTEKQVHQFLEPKPKSAVNR